MSDDPHWAQTVESALRNFCQGQGTAAAHVNLFHCYVDDIQWNKVPNLGPVGRSKRLTCMGGTAHGV